VLADVINGVSIVNGIKQHEQYQQRQIAA